MFTQTDVIAEEQAPPGVLGTEVSALFAGIELTTDILQLRGFVLAPVDFGG